MRFEENPEGINEMGRALGKAITEARKEVAATHSESSDDEIRRAFKAAVKKRGYPNFEPSDDMIAAIRAGGAGSR
jgi:Sec-independent protein translocase protein TatA